MDKAVCHPYTCQITTPLDLLVPNGSEAKISHVAVLIASVQNHPTLGGGKVVTLDDLMAEIRAKILKKGVMAKKAITERYDLLRSIQLLSCEYYRAVV
jgi:hypothetical protein